MKTYERVYEILAKSPDFVTGESLAKELGISRTAIWKAIQSLQDQGVVITSVRKKGYHLEKGDILLSQEISKQLNFPVYFNPDSTSTQLDAKHGMERQDPAPSLYLASNQGSAKGRFERHFHTSPHGGIYMSIHLKPNCHFSELPPYTMMVAASIVKAIQRLTGIDTDIKWVNDIFIDSHKVCGILTQAAFQMENLDPEYVIVGIGINLYMPTEGFGKELENIAGSVLQEQSGDIKNKILAETLNRYFYYYKNFAKKEFIAEYKKRSLVLGKGIRVVTKDGERKATALDIDDMCHLLVEYEDGTRENLSTGEISIRLQ